MQDQGSGTVDFWWELLSCLVDSHLLALCSHGQRRGFGGGRIGGESMLSGISWNKDINPIMRASPSLPHLQLSLKGSIFKYHYIGGLGLQRMNLGAKGTQKVNSKRKTKKNCRHRPSPILDPDHFPSVLDLHFSLPLFLFQGQIYFLWAWPLLLQENFF